MSLYQPYPPTMTPASQQSQQRTVATNLRAVIGSNLPPPGPRQLVATPGPLSALVTWNLTPQGAGALGVVGWRIYLGKETAFWSQTSEPIRQITIPLVAGQVAMVYVSAVTQQGVESPKVGVRAVGGASGLAVAVGTPGYNQEPTGGGFKLTRVP